MMNKHFEKFSEMKETLVNKISDKKNIGIQQLQELKANINKEIDNRLEKLYERKDLVKEALSEKVKFKNKKFLTPIRKYFFPIKLRYIISAPFIYMMIIPAVILDMFLEVYHRICFPIYGIDLVKRSDFFIYDRHHLSYLNWFEKLNCLYCSYFNNLIGYARQIAGKTEQYWCPIKHARKRRQSHPYYKNFTDYLDGKAYRKNLETIRAFNKSNEQD